MLCSVLPSTEIHSPSILVGLMWANRSMLLWVSEALK